MAMHEVGAGATVQQKRALGPLQEAMVTLDDEVSRVYNKLDQLEDRLVPLLQPDMSAQLAVEPGGIELQPMSDSVSGLRRTARSISTVASRLEGLLNRLDV